MGSYAERSLSPGETVRYTAALSMWRYFFHFLVGAVALALSLYGLVHSFGLDPSSMRQALIIAMSLLTLARQAQEMPSDKNLLFKVGDIAACQIL